jgi:hypothetical protein
MVNLVKIAAVMIIVIVNVLVTVIQVVLAVVAALHVKEELILRVTLVEPRVLEVVDHHVHRLVEVLHVPEVVDHRAHHLAVPSVQ